MTKNITEYQEIKTLRATLTRKNAGLRMAGKAGEQLPLPPLPAKPVKYLLEEQDGTYVGIVYNLDEVEEHMDGNDYKMTVLPYDKAL